MKKILLILTVLFSQLVIAQKKPNIVFILADDLGYGDVGCYGQQKIKTPNIDHLAGEGMKFTQFYSGSAVCAPARSTLLTGLHTGHTPIRGNKRVPPEGQVPMPDSTVTIAMLLQKAGYTTAAFGKWSMGFITTSGDPAKKGFDHFFGYNCQTLAHDYYPDHLWNDHQRIVYPDNTKLFTNYSADIIHQQALSFLQQQPKDHPFFLYLPYTLPHAELTVPHDEVYDYYVKVFNEKPIPIRNGRDTTGKPYEPYPHAAFAAMVARLDKFVGEILATLHDRGMDENTLVVFTSDNGPHKEGGGDPFFFQSSGKLTGIKRDLYEGGIREPFIARWKGVIDPSSVTKDVCAMWDMYPTFLELAGIQLQQKTDGISIVPALHQQKQPEHEYLYWELHESGGKQAVRYGKWKGVRLDVSKNPDNPIELYDLENDPAEKNNIAGQHPNIVEKIAGFMKEAHVENPTWPLFPDEKKKYGAVHSD
ncbi:MAG: arylsulfatase [Bacteroidota bacterium]|nr:arylsulfatase [Bacteroidota bacterium]